MSKKKYGQEDVQHYIASNPTVVNFGDEHHSVDRVWYNKAEEVLGYKMSTSFKWFLDTYGGGEIAGEEIYSLYGLDFKSAAGGDIVYHHLIGLEQGSIPPQHLVVSETDFGEVFYFDYDRAEGNECPLSLRIGSSEPAHYAANFYEFLCKRIRSHLPR